MTSSPSFVDVLLGNGDATFQAALQYPTGLEAGPVASDDFDQDGFADLVMASTGSGQNAVAILRGRGDGTFGAPEAYLNGSSSFGLAVADLNGDALPDVVTADRNELSMSVLLDQPDGALFAAPVSPVQGGGFSSDLVQADFDGDDKPDFAWTESFGSAVQIALGGPHGRFTQIAPFRFPNNQQISGIGAGDFTGDGKADLVLMSFQEAFLAPSLGDGTFGDPVSVYFAFSQLASPAIADFNGDGKLDFAVPENCCGSTNLVVLLGNGDGTFQSPIPSFAGQTLDILLAQPLTDGGEVDLLAGDGGSSVALLRGNGDGTFQPPVTILTTSFGPWFAAADEFNGDGHVDLLLTRSSPSVALLLGNGDGTFQAPVLIGLASNAGTLVAADFDGDGPADFAVQAGDVLLFRGIGNGHFQSPQPFIVREDFGILATGDYDGNGQPDVVSSGPSSFTTLLNANLGAVMHNLSVIVGSAAVLEASASGFGAVTYQWRKDGVPLADGGPISGSQTATLTIDPVAFTDAGSYDVVVTDSCTNVTSNAATLAVEFDDVPLSNPFHDDILTIATLGITGGCNTGTSYCPSQPRLARRDGGLPSQGQVRRGPRPAASPARPDLRRRPRQRLRRRLDRGARQPGRHRRLRQRPLLPRRPRHPRRDGRLSPEDAARLRLRAARPRRHLRRRAARQLRHRLDRGPLQPRRHRRLRHQPPALLPRHAVPREQMATFLVRTFLGP